MSAQYPPNCLEWYPAQSDSLSLGRTDKRPNRKVLRAMTPKALKHSSLLATVPLSHPPPEHVFVRVEQSYSIIFCAAETSHALSLPVTR